LDEIGTEKNSRFLTKVFFCDRKHDLDFRRFIVYRGFMRHFYYSMFAFLEFVCFSQFVAPVHGATHDNQISRQVVLHDTRDAFYRSPGWATTGPYRTGAVPAGTAVRLRIRTAANDLTACYIRIWDNEASTEFMIPMSIFSSDGVYDYWQGQVAFSKAVDTYYAFRMVDGSAEDWYQDDAQQDGGIGEATDTHEYNWDYSIVWYTQGFTTPAWHTRAVIYQIMTDGFYNGDISNDPAGNGSGGDVYWWEWDQNGTGGANPGGRSWIRKRTWGQSRTGGKDFYGGDFQGVQAKISYLTDLGINAIYFNPWMESPDNHGYSVNDYKSVNPYYGVVDHRVLFDTNTNIVMNNSSASLAVFDAMRSDLETGGIRVISDIVINHCGAQSRFFQRYEHVSPNWGIYDPWPSENGAYESQTSPWFNWFKFNTWNHDYQGWSGYKNLPQIQYVGTTALQTLVSGPDSVFNFWDSHGVCGYRLDVNNEYADGNNTRTVNRAIRSKVKALDTDAVVIAEDWGRSSLWLAGDMCDGTMNYRFRTAVLDWINGTSSTALLNNRLLVIQEDYPVAAQYACWALLGSHDTERVRTALGTAAKQKLAAIFQFSHIGPPVIWAGDELGMTGGKDPDNRRSMEWNLATGDNEILTLYKTLIHARTTYTPLAQGCVTSLLVANDVYAYGREVSAGNYICDAVIVLNRAASDAAVTIDVSSLAGLQLGEKLCDVLTGTAYAVSTSRTISLTVGATSGVILVNSIGDMDSDGDVDNSDFAVLAARWMKQYCIGPSWCDGCDLNKNGSVNIEDMAQWAQTWLLNRNP
jgi:alpha-glucosidase